MGVLLQFKSYQLKNNTTYIVYREALDIIESDRILYLAIPLDIYDEYGSELLVQRVLQTNKIKIILYEANTQHIVSWLK